MTAAQIIDQIKSLPPDEWAGVVRFVYELEAERKLSGTELSVLAERFVNAPDPTEASHVREEIVRGFYGGNRMPKIRRRCSIFSRLERQPPIPRL
ncbi:MAG: hypothetical protein QOI07_1417 [Verrucomicrobiota bacterium]|jgi:hypothetical protein